MIKKTDRRRQLATAGHGTLAVDVFDRDDHYVVVCDAPGLDPGSLDVTVDGSTVLIPRGRRIPVLFERRIGGRTRRSAVNDLIDTTEMYLRTIFELEEEGIVPMRARIAERLHQSGPTVS